MNLTTADKALLQKKGISEEKLAAQLAAFAKGFPYLELDGAASVGKGILVPARKKRLPLSLLGMNILPTRSTRW